MIESEWAPWQSTTPRATIIGSHHTLAATCRLNIHPPQSHQEKAETQ